MEVYAIKIQRKIEDRIFDKLLNVVNSEKKDRIRKFRFWQDAHNCLIAELLVRKIAHEELNIQNKKLNFSINEYGKPYIINSNGFEFNVSHSGEWVLVGVDDKPIGVDIEKIIDVDMNIAEKYFSPLEYCDLMESSNKLDYFFMLWSLKESFIKYIGKGLSYPLDGFSMMLSDKKIIVKIGDEIDPAIYFKLYMVDAKYKTAICSSNLSFPDEVKQIEVNELIESILISV